MIDVVSRYVFAYPTQNVTASTTRRCIVDVMIRHAYFPPIIRPNKGSQFRSEVVSEIIEILETQKSHASAKHEHTIEINERTHASIKMAFRIATEKRRLMWHKNLQISVLNLQQSFTDGYNYVLELQLGIKPQWKTTLYSDLAEKLSARDRKGHHHALLSRIQELL